MALPIKQLGLSLLQVSHAAEGEWARMAPFRILSLDIECAGRKASQLRALAAHCCAHPGATCDESAAKQLALFDSIRDRHVADSVSSAVSQGHFPEAEKDPVIQIASMVTVQGAPNGPLIKNIMTLDTCDSIVGAEASPVPRASLFSSFRSPGGRAMRDAPDCHRSIQMSMLAVVPCGAVTSMVVLSAAQLALNKYGVDCLGRQVMSFATERELLLRWRDLVVETDPDLIIGYNIVNFDLPYLIDRARALSIPDFNYWGRIRNKCARAGLCLSLETCSSPAGMQAIGRAPEISSVASSVSPLGVERPR